MAENFLKKDCYITGIVVAILVPLILTAILFPVNQHFLQSRFLSPEKILLLGVAINLLLMRFYFIKQKLDKTAKAMLGTVFTEILLIFLFKHAILGFFNNLM